MILALLLSLSLWNRTRVQEAATAFRHPPQELASHVIWGWDGDMDLATIRHDLDSIRSKGFRSVIIEAGYRMPFEYLSDGWFRTVRTAVLEAKARGLKVWIIDEGKYPSGFAGGKFTLERPEMRMKALVNQDGRAVPAFSATTWIPPPCGSSSTGRTNSTRDTSGTSSEKRFWASGGTSRTFPTFRGRTACLPVSRK